MTIPPAPPLPLPAISKASGERVWDASSGLFWHICSTFSGRPFKQTVGDCVCVRCDALFGQASGTALVKHINHPLCGVVCPPNANCNFATPLAQIRWPAPSARLSSGRMTHA